MKILVSGFDNFGGEKINPSIEAVMKLPDEISGAKIIKVEIPTAYKKSIEKLEEIIEKENPDVVLNIGQAGGRPDITVERVGININDFKIDDNEGNRIIDEKIMEDGDDAYFVSIPIKAIVKTLNDNNIPASISNTAGTFICNYVCYYMAYLTRKKYKNMRTGFIHVPFSYEQIVNKQLPSMSLESIIKAIELSIKTIVETDSDIKISGGTPH